MWFLHCCGSTVSNGALTVLWLLMIKFHWNQSEKIGLKSDQMPSPPSGVPAVQLTEPSVCSVWAMCVCSCVWWM